MTSLYQKGSLYTKYYSRIYQTHVSITLVLISPNMKDESENESDQWIPWEVSYSLKEITRNDRTSHTNAVLVFYPVSNFGYSLFS